MSTGLSSGIDITKMMTKASLANGNGHSRTNGEHSASGPDGSEGRHHAGSASVSSVAGYTGNYTTHDYENPQMINAFHAKPGYKQWVAQAGTLVADLLTNAGADHVCAS
jgi:ribose-phosphate pyrophosphokinase